MTRYNLSAAYRAIEKECNRRRGRFDHIREQIRKLSIRREEIDWDIVRHQKAFDFVKEVALQTQQEIEVRVSDIATLGMTTVLKDPYDIVLEFVERKNKTEGNIWCVMANSEKIKPLDATGGGVGNVAALSLRIASLSLQQQQGCMPLLILDEPFHFLTRNYQPYASALLKEMSDMTGMQIIIVTQYDEIEQYADRTFQIEKQGQHSVIVE